VRARLLHLGFGEEHMLLDHGVVLAELELGGELAGVLGLDVEEARAGSGDEAHQDGPALRLRHGVRRSCVLDQQRWSLQLRFAVPVPAAISSVPHGHQASSPCGLLPRRPHGTLAVPESLFCSSD
jgi:hypothetical protein